MGKFYEQSIVPPELRRNYDVYDRIKKIGLDLGTFEKSVTSLQGRNIASCTISESGLVYLSGTGTGQLPMNDDPDRVKHGQEGAREAADHHIRTLHWTLICGGEGGDLNDVLYTVKALGMVVSTDVEFRSGPSVVNGFSARWQSVFGGGIGDFAKNGLDAGGYTGVHSRSAIGGFTGRFSLEPEIIVAIPPALAQAIIRNRGWVFPLPPPVFDRVVKAWRSLGTKTASARGRASAKRTASRRARAEP
ncbi:MAG: hypothetical protein HY678_05850 [Chloroflexi bacterium]|nr:hypothetical protein [Chloroflexota bacterium]